MIYCNDCVQHSMHDYHILCYIVAIVCNIMLKIIRLCDTLQRLCTTFCSTLCERLHVCLPLLPDYVVTGEKDCMPACPYCPIRWSRERKITCMPAITARLGVHGRERLHACLPLLPDTARLGGHGREKLHACHYDLLR